MANPGLLRLQPWRSALLVRDVRKGTRSLAMACDGMRSPRDDLIEDELGLKPPGIITSITERDEVHKDRG
jgi:hypothetical protein